jgi:hypothetical protein
MGVYLAIGNIGPPLGKFPNQRTDKDVLRQETQDLLSLV